MYRRSFSILVKKEQNLPNFPHSNLETQLSCYNIVYDRFHNH